MPFEELPHTADWSLRVWASDLPHLFVESARGMNALAGVLLESGPRQPRRFAFSAADAESLLVAFLSEVIYAAKHDRLAFDHFDLTIRKKEDAPYSLSARLTGAPLRSAVKAIKAVTYHNLNIRSTPRGLEVEIVFDV